MFTSLPRPSQTWWDGSRRTGMRGQKRDTSVPCSLNTVSEVSREGKPTLQQTVWPCPVTSLWPATLQAGQRPQGTLPSPAQEWGHSAMLSVVKLCEFTAHLTSASYEKRTIYSDKSNTTLSGAFSATLPLHISHFCKHFTYLVNRKAVEGRLWISYWRARKISGPCGNIAGHKPVPELHKSFMEGFFFSINR